MEAMQQGEEEEKGGGKKKTTTGMCWQQIRERLEKTKRKTPYDANRPSGLDFVGLSSLISLRT